MKIRILGIIILAFLSAFTSVYGQAKKLILTREQNIQWLDSLKGLTFDQQLITVGERLLSDTNVFVVQSYNDRIKSRFNIVDSLGNRVYGDGKPTLIIDNHPMIIDNGTEVNQIINLVSYLSTKYIKTISILNPTEPTTTAIYGISGMSGIILMTLTKKKHLKKFKKIKLQSNGYRYT